MKQWQGKFNPGRLMGYLRLRTTEQLRRGGADRADTAPRLSPLFSCPGEENEWWCVQDLQGGGGRSLAASDSDGAVGRGAI